MKTNNLKGYPIERLAIIGAGAIAVEFGVNSMVANMTKDKPDSFLKKKGVPSAIKIAIGVAGIMLSKEKMVQDAALGAVAAGGLGLARAFMNIPDGIDGLYNDEVMGYYPDLSDTEVSGPMSPDGEDYSNYGM